MLSISMVVSPIRAMFFSRILILLALVCIAWFAVCPRVFAACQIDEAVLEGVYGQESVYYARFVCDSSQSHQLFCFIVPKSEPLCSVSLAPSVAPSVSPSSSSSVPFWEREIDCQLKNSIAGLLLSVNSFLTLVFGVRIVLGIVRRLLSSI